MKKLYIVRYTHGPRIYPQGPKSFSYRKSSVFKILAVSPSDAAGKMFKKLNIDRFSLRYRGRWADVSNYEASIDK